MSFVLPGLMGDAIICSDRERQIMPEIMPLLPVALVFIVDDDVPVCESSEELILSEGWPAVTSATPGALLALPIPDVPSCLILDISPRPDWPRRPPRSRVA